MRHQPINSSLFIKSRKSFVNKMKPNYSGFKKVVKHALQETFRKSDTAS